MQGIALIITFVIAIALMIFAISKLKIHPFLWEFHSFWLWPQEYRW